MAKLSKSEMFKKVKEYLKEDTSDEAIALLEDLTDTLSDTDEDKDKVIEELKKEKEELDKSWRQRYIDRFEGKVTENLDDKTPEEGGDIKIIKLIIRISVILALLLSTSVKVHRRNTNFQKMAEILFYILEMSFLLGWIY